MKPKKTIFIVVAALISQAPVSVVRGQANQAPVVVGAATEIPGVVEGGSEIQRILEGYNGLDDPIGLMDGTLVFAEPDARRLHRMVTETNEVSVLVAESNESHGVTQDAEGRLISAQAWDGSTRIGVIYPPAVYYIPPGGEPVRIEENMIRPNGIQLSRDERTLYISDSNGDHVIAWDIQPNGLVENRRDFGTLQGRSNRDNGLGGIRTFADGMAVDSEDRLYVATGGGIEVLSSRGEHLGTIPVRCPPRDCQNVAFGGPSKQTLYIAGAGSLYRVALIARGLAERAK